LSKLITKNIDTWKKLYHEADRFRDSEPWDVFYDNSQIFSVIDPVTQERYYCCVLGNAREVFALVAYRGDAGFLCHQRICNLGAVEEPEDVAFEQDCLMVEYVEKDDVPKSSSKLLKEIGLKYHGFGTPIFIDYRPLFMPANIDNQQAEILILCLEVASAVYFELKKDKKFLKKKNHTRTWSLTDDGKLVQNWLKNPAISAKKTQSHELQVKNLLKKVKFPQKGIWELGCIIPQMSVGTDSGDAYIPRTCLILDGETKVALGVDLIDPKKDSNLCLLMLFFNTVKSTMHLPKEILVQSSDIAKYLYPSMTELKINIKIVSKLSVASEFLEMFNSHIAKMGGMENYFEQEFD
jgi:hypothetical protein